MGQVGLTVFLRLVLFGREVARFETAVTREASADEPTAPRMTAGSAHNFERYPPSVDDCGGFGFR